MRRLTRLRHSVMVIAVAAIFAGTIAHASMLREPLDKIWEDYMLEGNSSSIHIEIKKGTISKLERHPRERSTYTTVTATGAEMLFLDPYGIIVRELGEGFWGNGGWVLQGGRLDQAGDGNSIIQLYVKAVDHRHSFFQFPFERDAPTDTGYEFFLLHRKKDIPGATIVRKWIFLPQGVVLRDSPHKPFVNPDSNVQAFLSYEPSIRTATIKITGLTRSIEERVDLSPYIQSTSPPQVESDGATHKE